MFKQVYNFFKNPVYQEDTNFHFKYRLAISIRLLLYVLVISFGLGLLIDSLETVFKFDLGKHAVEDFLDANSPWLLFGLTVIVAPILEELFFRGPLFFFKESRYFNYVFYALTFIFGFYHITNFELNVTILSLSPILVAPQLVFGVFLGFIRVRFGLVWAIALHSCYNLVLIGPIILLQILDIPLE